MAKILLIEDDKAIADITRYFLESQPDFSVVWAKDGADALRFIRQPFDPVSYTHLTLPPKLEV